MTAVLIAWVVSMPPLAVILGHRLAGRSVVATVREFAADRQVRAVAFWLTAVALSFGLAFATRGQVVTWDGVVAVQP